MRNRMEIIEDAATQLQVTEPCFDLLEDDDVEEFDLDDYLTQIDIEYTD